PEPLADLRQSYLGFGVRLAGIEAQLFGVLTGLDVRARHAEKADGALPAPEAAECFVRRLEDRPEVVRGRLQRPRSRERREVGYADLDRDRPGAHASLHEA